MVATLEGLDVDRLLLFNLPELRVIVLTGEGNAAPRAIRPVRVRSQAAGSWEAISPSAVDSYV